MEEKAIKLAMNHIMVWGLKDKFLIEAINIALKAQMKEVFKVIDEWDYSGEFRDELKQKLEKI